MNVLRIRNELRNGKSIFDLPLRVTFTPEFPPIRTNRSTAWKTRCSITLS